MSRGVGRNPRPTLGAALPVLPQNSTGLWPIEFIAGEMGSERPDFCPSSHPAQRSLQKESCGHGHRSAERPPACPCRVCTQLPGFPSRLPQARACRQLPRSGLSPSFLWVLDTSQPRPGLSSPRSHPQPHLSACLFGGLSPGLPPWHGTGSVCYHFPLLLQSLGVKCRHFESIRRRRLSIARSCPSTMSSDRVRMYWPWRDQGGQVNVGRGCDPLPPPHPGTSLPCSS